MKKLLFFLAMSAFVFTACNDDADGDRGHGSDSTGGHQAMIDNYKETIKAIETGDSATLARLIADDAVDHGAGENGADIRGAQIVRDLSEVHRAIDNLKMNIEQVAANDEYVFALVHMTGTTKEGVWGMPPNTKVDTRSVDVVKIKNGKATDHWTYISPAEMMAAMQGQPQPSVVDTVKNK